MKYHFEKYYPPFMEHIKRHFKGSGIVGSIFTHPNLITPKKAIDYAYLCIENEYQGERLIKKVEYGEIVGLESIIPILEIPKKIRIKRETRVKKDQKQRSQSYTVLIAQGLPQRKTSKLVIIAEPVLGKTNIHAFSSIYPGIYAPDFSDQKFWREHAFIDPRS